MGSSLCACHTHVCVLRGRWRSHEHRAPASKKQRETSGIHAEWMGGWVAGWVRGGVVSSPAPTTSFTFSCTRVGGRACLLYNTHVWSRPAHSWSKAPLPITQPTGNPIHFFSSSVLRSERFQIGLGSVKAHSTYTNARA